MMMNQKLEAETMLMNVLGSQCRTGLWVPRGASLCIDSTSHVLHYVAQLQLVIYCIFQTTTIYKRMCEPMGCRLGHKYIDTLPEERSKNKVADPFIKSDIRFS